MFSRETETFLFKNILKRGMRGTAESQGKETMRVALSFFFFFCFPGDKIIVFVCLCGKYLLVFSHFFTHSHTCACAGPKIP